MAGIRRSNNHAMRWPSRTRGEKPMTARSRWGIGGSAIVLVIVAVAFLGTPPDRNSVQARGVPPHNASPAVSFPPPGKVGGSSATQQGGAPPLSHLQHLY